MKNTEVQSYAKPLAGTNFRNDNRKIIWVFAGKVNRLYR